MSVAPHPDFAHVALLHDGPADLADRLAPAVREGLRRDEEVLVCLGPAAWDELADRLGDDAAQVTYLSAVERYDDPPGAMARLHAFVRDALDRGAPAVWSVGAIPLDGVPEVRRRWMRYEAAANDVLRHLPLRAVCLYDRRELDPELEAAVRRTHAELEGGVPSGCGHADATLFEACEEPAWTVPPAEIDVDLALTGVEPAVVRRALAERYGDDLHEDVLGDLLVVVSELVTNGLRHGAPPVTTRAWRRGEELVVEVTDHGPGIADPFPDLRPPATGIGGYGLWLAGQLAGELWIRSGSGATAVAARFTAGAPQGR